MGQLGKDIEDTKSNDMISKIRELIAEKPDDDDDEKEKQKIESTKEKDETKSKKEHKLLKPKDSIPSTDENAVVRSLLNQEDSQNEAVDKVKGVINEKTQENKRAFEKTKEFLERIEDGLLQFEKRF